MAFDRGYPSRLAFPPTLDHPTGVIEYWWKPLAYSKRVSLGEMGERGGTISAEIAVRWEDRAEFEIYAAGTTSVDTSVTPYRLTRQTPLPAPHAGPRFSGLGIPRPPHHYLTDLVLVNQGRHRPDPPHAVEVPGTSYSWSCEWAVYRAEFADRSYEVTPYSLGIAHNPAIGTTPELARYVTRRPVFSARERRISGHQLETEPDTSAGETEGRPTMEPAFVIDHQGTVQYVWHQIPVDAVPWPSIGQCIGRVNQYIFDNLTVRGRKVPAERFLLKSAAIEGKNGTPDPYTGPDSNRYVDVIYTFGWRPEGTAVPSQNPTWNQYARIKSDGSTKILPVRYTGTSNRRPYQTADFTTLFVPVG